jgi:methionyl-tRNA synthetase
MRMTIDNPVTVEQAVAYVDNLGNLFCVGCYHRYLPESFTRVGVESVASGDHCDRCGADMSQSVELVDGMATLEHFTCKIF